MLYAGGWTLLSDICHGKTFKSRQGLPLRSLRLMTRVRGTFKKMNLSGAFEVDHNLSFSTAFLIEFFFPAKGRKKDIYPPKRGQGIKKMFFLYRPLFAVPQFFFSSKDLMLEQ